MPRRARDDGARAGNGGDEDRGPAVGP
jgi:hypothetical protein